MEPPPARQFPSRTKRKAYCCVRPHRRCHRCHRPSRERDRINWQLRASERRGGLPYSGQFQVIRSTHCAREGPASNGSLKYWVSRTTFPSRNSMMLTV